MKVMRISIIEQGCERFLLNVNGDAGRLQFRLDELGFLAVNRRAAWNQKSKGHTTHACLREFGLGVVDVIAKGRDAATICPTAGGKGTLRYNPDTFKNAIEDLVAVHPPLNCPPYMNIIEWSNLCVEHDSKEAEARNLFIDQAGIRFRRRNIVGTENFCNIDVSGLKV